MLNYRIMSKISLVYTENYDLATRIILKQMHRTHTPGSCECTTDDNPCLPSTWRRYTIT